MKTARSPERHHSAAANATRTHQLPAASRPRLEQRGLVARAGTTDRRKVIVRLTAEGLALVEEVAGAHLATERQILAALSPRQQRELVRLLRMTLLELGDRAELPA